MAYPYPNITRPYEIVTYSQTVTNEFFGPMILLAIFVIAFIAMKNYKTTAALTGAAFVTFIISVLFWMIGIAHQNLVIVILLGLIGCFALLYFDKNI